LIKNPIDDNRDLGKVVAGEAIITIPMASQDDQSHSYPIKSKEWYLAKSYPFKI